MLNRKKKKKKKSSLLSFCCTYSVLFKSCFQCKTLWLIGILVILLRNEGSSIFCTTKPNEIIPCSGGEVQKNGVLEVQTLFPSFDAADLLLSKSRS